MNLESKEIRAWILKALYNAKPYPLSFQTITRGLMEAKFYCTEIGIKAHLKYLMDKGYTKYEHLERVEVKRDLNYITPKGIDLIEGSIPPDPGVMTID